MQLSLTSKPLADPIPITTDTSQPHPPIEPVEKVATPIINEEISHETEEVKNDQQPIIPPIIDEKANET